MHWFYAGGEIICESHYQTSVLWFRTLIQNDSNRMASPHDPKLPVEPEELTGCGFVHLRLRVAIGAESKSYRGCCEGNFSLVPRHRMVMARRTPSGLECSRIDSIGEHFAR